MPRRSTVAPRRRLRWALRRTSLVVVLVGGLCAHSSQVLAQCGAKRSSCSVCHDGVRASLPSEGPWHENHAFADVCATCHGGRGDTSDLTEAHVGLVRPLTDVETQCATCHGEKAEGLAARYRPSLAPASVGDAGSPMKGQIPDLGRPFPTSRRADPHGETKANLALLLVAGLLGIAGGAFVVREERRYKRSIALADRAERV